MKEINGTLRERGESGIPYTLVPSYSVLHGERDKLVVVEGLCHWMLYWWRYEDEAIYLIARKRKEEYKNARDLIDKNMEHFGSDLREYVEGIDKEREE